MREQDEIRALSPADLLRELASYTVMMGLLFSRPRLLSQEATRRADAAPAAPRSADLPGPEVDRLKSMLEQNLAHYEQSYKTTIEWDCVSSAEDLRVELTATDSKALIALLTPSSPTQEMRAAEAPAAPRSGTGVTVEGIARLVWFAANDGVEYAGPENDALWDAWRDHEDSAEAWAAACAILALLQAPRPGGTGEHDALLYRVRAAFNSDRIADKNIALRRAYDAIAALTGSSLQELEDHRTTVV